MNAFRRWLRSWTNAKPRTRSLSLPRLTTLEDRLNPAYSLLHSWYPPDPSGPPQAESFFGSSVASDSNFRVVGSPREDVAGIADVGVARVYNTTTGALIVTLNNPSPAANDQFGWSVAISGSTVVVGAVIDDTGATDSGTAYVFNAMTGVLLATLNNPSPAANDQFGGSVAISGSTVVVGAFLDDAVAGNSGRAYVFNALTGAMIATLNNPSPAAGVFFGNSVAVSGSTVVVGAYGDDAGATDSGRAYAFNSSTGALIATFNNPSPAANDQFGVSVSVSGSTVVVGANRADTGTADSGQAYVFYAATGTLIATLNNPTPDVGDNFGISVSISGSTVVVGANLDDTGAGNSGSAYAFNAATGALITTLSNPSPAANDYFGYSVSVSGSTVVVGAYADDTGAANSGSAYVFNATTGALITTLANPSPATGDLFGSSVAISGNYLVVGAPQDDAGAINSGRAYVYDSTTGALIATLNNPSPAADDGFGYPVSVSGSTIVVGAYGDDTGAVDSGAAYVFDAVTGALVATLNNPSPAISDFFGYSVSVSGTTVVVGAPYDDTGAGNSGSVYVFNATTGALISTLANPSPAISDFFGSSVSVSGSTAVVGAYYDDTGAADSGSAYVFNATTGALVATLTNPSPAITDFFGWSVSVSVSGSTVVVGAIWDDTGAPESGSAYVFNATTGALITTLANPSPTISDMFGWSVSVSGSTVVVGALNDDMGAGDSGSAYVFDATTGALITSLTNPSPAFFDRFGYSVGVSGSTVVIGAYQDDTQNTDQGAVHLFSNDTTPPGNPVFSSTPANPSNNTGPTFTWSPVADSGGAGLAGYQTKLDGGVWSSIQTGTTATLSGLAQGSHTFMVRAVDNVGNVSSTPASYTWTVDTTTTTLLALKPIVTGGNVVNVNLMALAPNSKLPWQIIGFQAEFSETVTGVTLSTLTGLSATSLTVVNGTTVQFGVTTITNGTFTVGIAPVTDLAGNVGLLGTTSNTFSTKFGDVNGSGNVTNADLNAIRNVYLFGLPYNAFYDLNGDGIVDREDYNLARSRIGT